MLKKHRIFIWMVLLLAAASVWPAWATELPPTGTEKVYCITTFNVRDDTGSSFKDDIIVSLTNIATDEVSQVKLTHYTGYTGHDDQTIFGFIGNTTYKIAFSFSDSDVFEIVNEDGSPIGAVAATESGLDLKWKIQKISGRTHGEYNNEISSSFDGVETDVLKTFVQKTSFIEDDSNYATFLANLTPNVNIHNFIKLMSGTEDEWQLLSAYEKFCIINLYLKPCGYATNGDYNMYMRDLDTFLSHFGSVKNALDVLSKKGVENTDVVYDALIEALTFQYDYFKAHGTMLNVFSGATFLEESGEAPVNLEAELENNEDQEKETIQEARRELIAEAEDDQELQSALQELSSSDENGNSNAKDNVFVEIFKGKWFTLLLAAIAIVAVGVLVLKRKIKDKGGN